MVKEGRTEAEVVTPRLPGVGSSGAWSNYLTMQAEPIRFKRNK